MTPPQNAGDTSPEQPDLLEAVSPEIATSDISAEVIQTCIPLSVELYPASLEMRILREVQMTSDTVIMSIPFIYVTVSRTPLHKELQKIFMCIPLNKQHRL